MTPDEIKKSLELVSFARKAHREATIAVAPLIQKLVEEVESFDVIQRDRLFKEEFAYFTITHPRRINSRDFVGFEIEDGVVTLNFVDRDNDEWNYTFPGSWLSLSKKEREEIWMEYWEEHRNGIIASKAKKEEEQKSTRYQQFLKLKEEFGG